MSLTYEQQLQLRRCYDEGMNKRATMKETGISEATVYRYFIRWEALKRDVIDLYDIPAHVMAELHIQAAMRQMKPYELILRMITIAAEDNLCQAIFDIHDQHPAKKRLVDET